LVNLITNAIKFSPEDGIINMRADVADGHGIIVVSDNGIGIPKADLEQIFSSFYRAANATNIQGTGLGLHIVKRFTELMGGSVNIDSELDRGTTVTINIPVK